MSQVFPARRCLARPRHPPRCPSVPPAAYGPPDPQDTCQQDKLRQGPARAQEHQGRRLAGTRPPPAQSSSTIDAGPDLSSHRFTQADATRDAAALVAQSPSPLFPSPRLTVSRPRSKRAMFLSGLARLMLHGFPLAAAAPFVRADPPAVAAPGPLADVRAPGRSRRQACTPPAAVAPHPGHPGPGRRGCARTAQGKLYRRRCMPCRPR